MSQIKWPFQKGEGAGDLAGGIGQTEVAPAWLPVKKPRADNSAFPLNTSHVAIANPSSGSGTGSGSGSATNSTTRTGPSQNYSQSGKGIIVETNNVAGAVNGPVRAGEIFHKSMIDYRARKEKPSGSAGAKYSDASSSSTKSSLAQAQVIWLSPHNAHRRKLQSSAGCSLVPSHALVLLSALIGLHIRGVTPFAFGVGLAAALPLTAEAHKEEGKSEESPTPGHVEQPQSEHVKRRQSEMAIVWQNTRDEQQKKWTKLTGGGQWINGGTTQSWQWGLTVTPHSPGIGD